ncbi:SDR family NAD(P)-dependent oxidoreductase [Achromobacter aloeverae]|uniref:Oxidoreductase n=1 Tax=Achromobacter aloeverae TaxID=1750518 RepID=A0A4Q1HKY0_9BURK|nr:SDR family oxidoreductase [Achromobacter aloeverae]RXN90138.1 oxidoreductase [Achromobacter aloeverae]
MAKRFEGKVVAITGGSEGIGLATAKLFAAEGAQVYVTGRRQDRLDEAVREIGGGAVGVQGDASNLADLDRLYARIEHDHGKLDVVFANAGIGEIEPRPLGTITEESFDLLFGLNVRGLLFTVQKALPLMAAGSTVILNGSVAGSKGFAGQSLYNASKAAVRSFARTWTADLKDRGIRVNVVAPGGTETRLMRGYLEAHPGFEDMLRQAIPLERLGVPEEIGRAVLFLASSESSYIAGVELHVDGGSIAV